MNEKPTSTHMRLSNHGTKYLFFVGALGFIAGFVSWLVWLVLSVLSFTGRFYLASGIFLLGDYLVVIAWLLDVSFLFSAFGFFGLKKQYGSNISLACGVFSLLVFLVTIFPYSPNLGLSYYYFDASAALFFGLILWGAAFTSIQAKTRPTGACLAAGILLLVSGIIGISLFKAIAYWGIEFWYLLGGGFFAVGAILAALIMYKAALSARYEELSKTPSGIGKSADEATMKRAL